MFNLDRIHRVKRSLVHMRIQSLELQETIKVLFTVRSNIHRVLRKSSRATVGIRTIRQLEDAGISNMADLAKLSLENLIELKIRKNLAEQIHLYCQKRMM